MRQEGGRQGGGRRRRGRRKRKRDGGRKRKVERKEQRHKVSPLRCRAARQGKCDRCFVFNRSGWLEMIGNSNFSFIRKIPVPTSCLQKKKENKVSPHYQTSSCDLLKSDILTVISMFFFEQGCEINCKERFSWATNGHASVGKAAVLRNKSNSNSNDGFIIKAEVVLFSNSRKSRWPVAAVVPKMSP